MLTITLPDGAEKSYSHPMTTLSVAQEIGAGLARATLAGEIAWTHQGQEHTALIDATLPIERDVKLRIITVKDPEGIEIIRHSCAHLIGHAIKRLYPDTKMAIGPVIDIGFYYDVECSERLTPDNLAALQAEMKALIDQAYDVRVEVVSRAQAQAVFEQRNEPYKLQILAGIPEGEIIKLYYHQEYIDMCRGPHVPNTRHLKAFQLTRVSGAYWRGDASQPMLQRIYGTAWDSSKALKAYLNRVAEAEKRDHRKLGKQLDLFHIQEEAPGMVFWHPKGWALYQVLEQYVRQIQLKNGYQEIKTPQVVDRVLWEKSGHWDKFGDAMMTTASENREFAIKPMNCPGHVQIFNQGVKSYRDLPVRLAEFGYCHRNEPSGTLHGLMRVRSFTQDDAHIFCTEHQIQQEVMACIELVLAVYRDFGFDQVQVKLSTRPEKRVGSDAVWDKAEQALQQALQAKSLDWTLLPGEGAFYGPKIEFSLCDSLDRVWQCGTIQVDFSMPERLEAQYIDENSQRKTPVMLHRAVLGSFERFIGILIEHYAGKLPLWLAPIQILVLNISDKQFDYAKKVEEKLASLGWRTNIDLRNEKIGFKIREHTLLRVPYFVIIGDSEVQDDLVSIRSLDGTDLGRMSLLEFNQILEQAMPSLGIKR